MIIITYDIKYSILYAIAYDISYANKAYDIANGIVICYFCSTDNIWMIS